MFTVCGLNYKTAPLHVREGFALPAAQHPAFLKRLHELKEINEVLLLSTCNRTEIYCDIENKDAILPWLANEFQLTQNEIEPYWYVYEGLDAVLHVLRVAVGLDSMMLGEPQIFGQLKKAYQLACQNNTVATVLHQTFQYVFNACKRIRHLSGIGNNPVSIAYAAASLIKRFFTTLNALNVLVIGSGETATLVAKYLREQGVTRFMFASRNQQNAHQLARTFDGESFDITKLPLYLSKADVVVSATACPLPFISKSLVSLSMSSRQDSPMFLLDLAVPRDIEPDVGQLEGVQLYNIDELHAMVDKGLQQRKDAATKAEHLLMEELNQYHRWQRTLRANEMICDYRNQIKEMANVELARAKQKLSNGQCQYHVLEEFSERLLNKLAHEPTIRLREAMNNQHELADMA